MNRKQRNNKHTDNKYVNSKYRNYKNVRMENQTQKQVQKRFRAYIRTTKEEMIHDKAKYEKDCIFVLSF